MGIANAELSLWLTGRCLGVDGLLGLADRTQPEHAKGSFMYERQT